ncbi:uncharacterized protein LOC135951524 [Calliphora vicina]|uniref:uncharacterized protein LOC135951524 n=1 Tax=Calliphora vicina TaxID=7373 RepID=UPI00325AB446
MEMHQIKNILLVVVLIIQLAKCNCNNNYNNAFPSNQRFKRGSTIHHSTIRHLLPLLPHMSFHTNIHNLPENAIYCTKQLNSDTERYKFLQKYYSAIQGKPEYYVNKLECIYPREVEFTESEDEKPLKGIDKLMKALKTESDNFREFLDKVNRGEHPEPYKPMDVEALTDELISENFPDRPDRVDALQRSAPNGVICEHIKFNEPNKEGKVLEIERPICYAAQRPPIPTATPPTITKYPTVTTVTKSDDAEFLNKACYVLCHTGLIYQILPCCRR